MKKTALFMAFIMLLSVMVFPTGTFAANVDPYIGFNATNFDATTSSSAVPEGAKLAGGANQTYTYKDIDFGDVAPTSVTLEAAGQWGAAQTFKMYLDDPNGNPFAEFTATLSSWSVPVPITVALSSKITGKHTLYLKTSSSTCDFYGIRFAKPLAGSEAYVEYNPKNNMHPDIAASKYRREINMISSLGLSLKEKGEKYFPHLPVTRGNFTQVIYKIMNSPEENGKDVIFPDVPTKSEHYESVSYASKKGYISGYEDGLFRPEKFISISEAVKIMSIVLGYDIYAEKEGGFESGYLTVAHNLGLLDGISGETVLTNETMARLIYNAICGKFFVPTAIGKYGVDYTANEEGILSSTMNIYRVTGNVSANNITSLKSPGTKYTENYVYIDGYDYDAGETDARALLGFDCEVFFRLDDGERIIVSIAPIKNVEITEINSKDYKITYIGLDEVRYIDAEGNDEEIELDNPNVIYNGVSLHDSLGNVMEKDEEGKPVQFRGRIKYVQNKSGENVLFIDEYVNIEVSGIDLVNKSIFDGIKQETRKYPDGDGFSYFEVDGEPTSFMDLKTGTVASVYASKNIKGQKISRYIISGKVVSGKVTQVGTGGIVIDGKTYKAARELEETITVGMEGEFKINAFDEIVVFTNVSAAKRNIGWLVKQGETDPTSLTKQIQVRIYEQNGIEAEYKMADNCYVDGREYKDNTAVLTDVMCNTFVAYVLDASGKIKELDTIVTDVGGDKDCLAKISEPAIFDWSTSARTASYNSGVTNFILGDDVKVLNKPKNVTNTETWTWTTTSSLDAMYSCGLYSFNKEEGIINIIERLGAGSKTSGYVFVELGVGVDSNGDTRTKMITMNGTSKKEFFIADTYPDDILIAEALTKGDMVKGSVFGEEISSLGVVRLKSGAKALAYGEGKTITPDMYDAEFDSEGNIITAGKDSKGTMSDKNTERYFFGKVVSRDGNFVKIVRPNTAGSTQEYAYLGSMSGTKCTGTGASRLIRNNISKDSIEIGDLVVFVSTYTTPKDFYIIGNVND